MKIHISLEGAGEAVERLRELHAAVNQSPRALLQGLGQLMASAFQENIRTEGARLADRGIAWPPLHWLTRKIREFYGHGAGGPRLIRTTGDLLRSINVLDSGESFVEVGTRVPHAAVLHHGGTWVDPKTGASREVQAFPFVVPSRQDVDDWTEAIFDFFLPPAGEGSRA